MGITGFQPFIRKTYNGAFNEKWLKTYDNLYIDLNFVLHNICDVSNTIEELLENFINSLKIIIKEYTPTKRLFLIADGVAPNAKLFLQRERRINNISKNLSLHLSVGSKFMRNLEENLNDFIKSIEEKYNIEIITQIIDPNEGEIKIRYQVQKIQNKNKEDTHAIYSGDSDTILLLMTCDDVSKIYNVIKIKSEKITLHIGKLFEIHENLYGGNKYDFVFLNMLMGNDYIPSVSCLKFENLWDSYKFFSKYFEKLIYYETENKLKINETFFNCVITRAIKDIKKGYLVRFNVNSLIQEEINNNYKKYVEGLFWCFNMYAKGDCYDYEYIYDIKYKPHVYGVLLSLLANSTYELKKNNPLNYELCGILLIPSHSKKNVLTKKQILISQELEKEFSILYEEEKCNSCKENKEHKNTHKKLDLCVLEKIKKYYLKISDNFDNYEEYKIIKTTNMFKKRLV